MSDDDRDPMQAEFEDYRRPPEDVVPRRGMTAEALRDLDRRCGTGEPLRNGGAMTFDADGNPTGMEPTQQFPEGISRLVVTRRLIYKLGLRPEDLPNAHIID